MNDDTPIQYIDTAAGLAAFCSRLSAVDWFALDTEFLREKTYYPKLCLLQIATSDEVACIDPLALDDLGPLLAVLADPRITKVMHSCRQDMEIFYQLAGQAPAPVFDTQVAAPLLGYADQIGYANLVKEIAGVSLDKLHTRADWSIRPLTQAQIRYAADDVIYLVDIYRRIVAQLQELGRLDWLAEDFRQLSDAGLYDMAPASAWLKVKGVNRLKGASLSILQALAQWREVNARQKDRPRGWLLRDDAMLDIARHKPVTLEALKAIRGLSDGLVNRSGEELLELVSQAVAHKPAPLPDSGTRTKLSAAQEALVDVMMAVVRITADENQLNPSVLAGRRDLEALLLDDPASAVLHGWRHKLIGERLQRLLSGQQSLTVRDGRLVL
ncbi:MAG TPA: ribonuclease D [Gammaproteobacteria bacterium]|nr:ribonuclease D [Gammaproteobacteria bacterium]